MGKRTKLVLGVVVLLGVLAPAATAHAQCCGGYTLATACSGETLTRSRWCVQDTVPTGQSALPKAFCSYGDKVVSTLEAVFNMKALDIFEYELDAQTGGAHTGTACGHFGDGVAYDAFTGSAYGATAFWGYLLSLHEAINVWTGMSSSGWPTDWWADHQSAFPNLMDFRIMDTIGLANSDPNLVKAAAAQKTRFYPGGDSADPKVVALDNVFMAMPGSDGFAGFSRVFALQSGDGVKWDDLGVLNPDVKRSEYVASYMSLAAGQPVLPILKGPGANGGGDICNNVPDGTPGDAPYTCSEAHIDAIATAHCSIAANGRPTADLSALRSGDYSSIPSGPCGSTCPSECGCDSARHCVAPWLGNAVAGDAGTDGGGGSGRPDAGGAGGGAGGTNAGAGGTSAGAGGTTDAGGGGAEPFVTAESGCACRAVAGGTRGSFWTSCGLALLAIVRARTRRR